MSGPANETQIGGAHYKGTGEEHWDRAHRLGLDYFQAQITKYVERCWLKNGVEDLKKAQHFIQKYIEISGDRLGEKQMNRAVDLALTLGSSRSVSLSSYSSDELFFELQKRGALQEINGMDGHARKLKTIDEPNGMPQLDELEVGDDPVFPTFGPRGPMCKECGQYISEGHAPSCGRPIAAGAGGGPLSPGADWRG